MAPIEPDLTLAHRVSMAPAAAPEPHVAPHPPHESPAAGKKQGETVEEWFFYGEGADLRAP